MTPQEFIEKYILADCNNDSHNIGILTGDQWDHFKENGPPTVALLKHHLVGDAPLSIRVQMDADSTRLACLDFDLKPDDDITLEAFKDKVNAIVAKLRTERLRPMLFRSRGGKGVNVWLRWQAAQSVRDVRGALINILEACGLKEGNRHVANNEVEIYPAEWHTTEDQTPRCIALPMFNGNPLLNDIHGDAPLPDTWLRSNPVPHYSIPVDEVDLPDQLYSESVIKDALTHVPHNEDFELWLKVGYALKRAFHDLGFELWDEWSCSSVQYKGSESLRTVWDRQLRERRKGKPVTVGTIIHLARKTGWTPPEGLGCSFTDLGMARMLAEKYHDKIRWCSTDSEWYYYADNLWRLDEGRVMVRRFLNHTLIDLNQKATALKQAGNDLGDKMAKFALRYEKSAEVVGALRAAESLSDITIRLIEFDADPSRVLTKNGVVIHFTRDGGVELENTSPELYFRQQLGVSFNKDASCPQWRAWLAEMFPDKDVAYFIKRMSGAAIGGRGNKVKRVPFLFGESGDNGKTAFLKVLRLVFGDYGSTADPNLFADGVRPNNTGGARADLVSLRGKRFVMMPEVSSQMHLDEATLRNFTGGEYRKARTLYDKSETEWEPLEMYWLAGNSKPRIVSNLNATFNRFGLIEIDWSCPQDQQRDDFARELFEDEAPGILSWLITGWRGYVKDGRGIPEAMTDWLKGYQKEEDAIALYKDQQLIKDDAASVPLSDLWEHFTRWHLMKFRDAPAYQSRTLKNRLAEYDVHFINPQKEGVVMTGWRIKTTVDVMEQGSDIQWLDTFIRASIEDDDSPSKYAATTILKECKRLGLPCLETEVQLLGGRLASLFADHGSQGDALGLTIIELGKGIEFHRIDLDGVKRYYILEPLPAAEDDNY